jgi:hypothetical protein
MEVDESAGIRCDLCKSLSHINCMDVAPDEVLHTVYYDYVETAY